MFIKYAGIQSVILLFNSSCRWFSKENNDHFTYMYELHKFNIFSNVNET